MRLSFVAVVVVAVGIQLVPYGHDHSAGREPALDWPSEEAATLFAGACADCHTEQTHWPWYSSVAPMSWLVQSDVDRGRAEWNLSEEVDDLDDAAEQLVEGSMPPFAYTLMHGAARLSDEEEALLVDALEAIDRER